LLRGGAAVGLAAAASALLPACRSGGDSGAGDEPPPETTTIRLNRNPLSCIATEAVAVDFLKQEGFTDVQLLDFPLVEQFAKLAAGAYDLKMYPSQLAAARIDAGDPIVILGGVHVGCWQIFGTDAIKSLNDFKGKTMATGGVASPDQILLAATLASVGLDYRTDVRLVTLAPSEHVASFASGAVDGLLALPPFTNQLRAAGVGHVVADSMMDRPWSQYYCCMAAVNRDFMSRNPVATKRALRALMKAADLIALDPERGARRMVELGFTGKENYEAIVNDLRMMPFNVWRQYDPTVTLNFYALRLKEAGLIKGTPDQVISRGTDFRLLSELRRELKSP